MRCRAWSDLHDQVLLSGGASWLALMSMIRLHVYRVTSSISSNRAPDPALPCPALPCLALDYYKLQLRVTSARRSMPTVASKRDLWSNGSPKGTDLWLTHMRGNNAMRDGRVC